MSVWPTIERFVAEHGAAALVTLAEAQGSTPREAGARMVVRSDGGFSGTIGGGALEWTALAEAQSLLARPDADKLHRIAKVLGPDLGQCCGGRVTITIERFDGRDRDAVAALADAERLGPIVTIAMIEGGRLIRSLAPSDVASACSDAYVRLADGRIIERFGSDATVLYLFGAGHIGRSMILALAPLPFAVTWVDARNGAFPSHVPGNVTCVADSEAVRLLARAPDGAFVAVMTHSHALDLDLVAAALASKRFSYVGLIGSATKRARFAGAMRKIGIPADAIERLTCPIGLTEIRDKAPAAIAAAIVAQLLIVRETMARPLTHDGRGHARSELRRVNDA